MGRQETAAATAQHHGDELTVLTGRRVEYVTAGTGGDLRGEEFVGRRGTILDARYNEANFRRPAGLPYSSGGVHVLVHFDGAEEDSEARPWLWLDGCRLLEAKDEPEREALLAEARTAAESWIGVRVAVAGDQALRGRWGVVVEAEPSGNVTPGGEWSVKLGIAFSVDRPGGPEILYGFDCTEICRLGWPGQPPEQLPTASEPVRLLVAALRSSAAWRERAVAAEGRLRTYEHAMGDVGRVFRSALERVGHPA